MANHNHDNHNHMDPETREKILKRLSIAEGHVRKVRSMVENNAYCPDVIHQSQAVQSALRKTDQIILDSHLHNCVLSDIKQPKSKKEKIVNEIIEVFRKRK